MAPITTEILTKGELTKGTRIGYRDYVSLGEYQGTVLADTNATKGHANLVTVRWDGRTFTSVEFIPNLRRLI